MAESPSDAPFLVVQAFHSDGSEASSEQRVLHIFTRATAWNPVATSGDGELVALGNGHVATWDPRFVLVGKDGRKVTDELRLLDSADNPLFDCFTLTGTQHGALAAVADLEAAELRLIELNATGQIVQSLAWPTPGNSTCPRSTVDPSGIYLSFGIPQVDPQTTDVYRLSDATLTKVAEFRRDTARGSYSWLAGGTEPLLARNSDQGVTFARLANGSLVALSGVFPGTLIDSASDGRVFVQSIDAAGFLSITEIACGPAIFAGGADP
jgi:hypothetical protein